MIQDGPMQYLHSCARRLYRIFIHAYEHHNEMFRAFEVALLEYRVNCRTRLGCILYFLHLQNGFYYLDTFADLDMALCLEN